MAAWSGRREPVQAAAELAALPWETDAADPVLALGLEQAFTLQGQAGVDAVTAVAADHRGGAGRWAWFWVAEHVGAAEDSMDPADVAYALTGRLAALLVLADCAELLGELQQFGLPINQTATMIAASARPEAVQVLEVLGKELAGHEACERPSGRSSSSSVREARAARPDLAGKAIVIRFGAGVGVHTVGGGLAGTPALGVGDL